MKNYYYLLMLIISLQLVSCDPDAGKIPAKGKCIIDSKNKDGSVTQKEYSDGKIKSEFRIKDHHRDGQGLVYYPNGKLQAKYYYEKGKLQGKSIWYYESGKVYEIKNYIHHKKQGSRKTYYENGKLKSELEYKDDMPQVGLKEYSTSGKLLKQPVLVVTSKNRVVYENKYILNCCLSDKSKRVSFNQIKNYQHSEEYPIGINHRDGVGELIFFVYPGNFLMEEVTIRAQAKTAFGNPLILEKTIRVTAENR